MDRLESPLISSLLIVADSPGAGCRAARRQAGSAHCPFHGTSSRSATAITAHHCPDSSVGSRHTDCRGGPDDALEHLWYGHHPTAGQRRRGGTGGEPTGADPHQRPHRITLRATYVRDINGHLHIVPNGEVRIVSNQTKEWSRALVDVGVAYEEDLDRALHVLEGVAAAFAQDPAFEPQLLEPPQVVGPVSLGDWAITVRVMVKTQPGKQWGVARELQKRILATCEREDITLPYPRQEVWGRDFGHGDAKLSGG